MARVLSLLAFPLFGISLSARGEDRGDRLRLLTLSNQVLDLSHVDLRKRKFTNVYPSRGGVSKILPARSAASRKRRSRAASTVPAKTCLMNSQYAIAGGSGGNPHVGRHGRI